MRPDLTVKTRSVILLSGGLDSSANLAICAERDMPVLALTVDYGQRAAIPEIEASRRLCAHYGVRHETVDLRWLGALGGSGLTDIRGEVPEVAENRLDDRATTEASAKAVWVPNRNGVLINVAAAWAETLGASRVVVGFNREEAATFPDNTTEFLDQASRALGYSTANGVGVFSYTDAMDKREIVAAARGLPDPLPFDLVWSCYHAGPQRCGRCESCRRFERALKGAVQ